MVTKAFKIYGREGHRQKESFSPSQTCDWSEEGKTRRVALLNSDMTGTNEYSLLVITRDSEEEVRAELDGQINDGFFENSYVGNVVELENVSFENDYNLYELELPEVVIEKLKQVCENPQTLLKQVWENPQTLPKGKKKLIGYYDMVTDKVHIVYSVYTEFLSVYEQVTFFSRKGNGADLLEAMQRNLKTGTFLTPWKGDTYKCIFKKGRIRT